MEGSTEEATFVAPVQDFDGVLNSAPFIRFGLLWRVGLSFPREITKYMFIRLELHDQHLPGDWNSFTTTTFTLVDKKCRQNSIETGVRHHFSAADRNSGFSCFMPRGLLFDVDNGFILNSEFTIEVSIELSEITYVGLKSQHTTCFSNSFVQTLYHLPIFRKAVYREVELASGSLLLELQRVFYQLQHNVGWISTNNLIKVFGWSQDDLPLPHEAQAFNAVLCERLNAEDKLLFEGHYEYVDGRLSLPSTKTFYELQLDMKGCRNIYDSLDKFTNVELHHAGDRDRSEHHGWQGASVGELVRFKDFPPILQLHLKRFVYDFDTCDPVKINDRFEFPLELELDRYLSSESEKTARNLYALYSILSHHGGVDTGHCCAYIRPRLNQWFKFDDELITEVEESEALGDLYGGELKGPRKIPAYNAYMLVYVRVRDMDDLFCQIDENLSEHMKLSFVKAWEAEEEERRREEALSTSIIKVACDCTLTDHIGHHAFFGLAYRDELLEIPLTRQSSINALKELVASRSGASAEFLRFWTMETDKDLICRANRPLTNVETTYSVGHLLGILNIAELILYAYDESSLQSAPTSGDLLIFFKNVGSSENTPRFVTTMSVPSSLKPVDIIGRLNEMVGYNVNEEIDLVKETDIELGAVCEFIRKNESFLDNQIKNGEIVWYFKSGHLDDPGFEETIEGDFDKCEQIDRGLSFLLHEEVSIPEA